MIDACETILNKIDRTIVEFADMRVYESNELSITVRKGKPESISSDKLTGIGIRVLVDGVWGFSSVVSLDRSDIHNALQSAMKMAKGASKSVSKKVKVNTNAFFAARNELKPDINPKDISVEEKLSLTENVEKVLREHDNRITNSVGRFTEKIQREQIINTNGTQVVSDYGIFRLSGLATARSGNVIQNVSDTIATNAGLKMLMDWNIEENMSKVAQRGINLLDAIPSPSGKTNLLLEPSIVGVYIHEAFGHASEGDAILSNRSVLRDQIGNQLAVNQINVIDDPTLKGMRGSFEYDSEGTPTKRRQILKDGILLEYLNDLSTSNMLTEGNSLNGAGRATDFRHTAMPRMGNTYIDNGEMSFDELLEAISNGVYLQYSYGGYVNPASGQFYFSTQGGYLIENGELTKPIRNSGMSGMTLDVLKNTIGVGNDLKIDAFSGVCGKGSLTGFQPMPVTGGGPHIATKDIVVGGKK